MLCRKKFTQLNLVSYEDGVLYIEMYCEGRKVSCGRIDIAKYGDALIVITFKCKNAIEIYSSQTNKLIERFYSESILWQRSCGSHNISGFDNFRDLMNYELLYVGISRKDSFNRLIDQNHHAQAKILRNELPITKGGIGVASEIFVLCWRMDNYFIKNDFIDKLHLKEIDFVEDSEKAFIRAFRPKYNHVIFDNYFEDNKISEVGVGCALYYILESLCLYNKDKCMIGNNTELCQGEEPDSIFINYRDKTLSITGIRI